MLSTGVGDAPKSCATRWPVLLVALVATVVFFYRLGSAPLNDWDEAWHAEVSREILTTGDWLTLHYRGDVYFNKPPLTFWIRALSFKAFGVTEWSARLPGASFAWTSVVLVTWFAARRFGGIAGTVAGLCLCTSWLFTTYHAGRSGETDGTLICFHVLTFLALWRARRSPGWFYAAAVFTALGWMTKGSMAYLPWLAAGVAAALDRTEPRWRWRHFAGGLAFALVLASPWQIAMLLKHGRAFVHAFYVHEAIEPALGVSEGHGGSAWVYVRILQVSFQPWLSLAAAGALLGVILPGERRPAARWVTAWAIVMLATCALIRTKLVWYVIPAMPPLAILAGVAAAELAARPIGRAVLAATVGLAAWQFVRPYWTPPPAWADVTLVVTACGVVAFLPAAARPAKWAVALACLLLAAPLALDGVGVARVIRDQQPPDEDLLLREPDEPWGPFMRQVATAFPGRPVRLVGFGDSPAAEFYVRRAVGDALVTARADDARAILVARVETADSWRAQGYTAAFAKEGLAAFMKGN